MELYILKLFLKLAIILVCFYIYRKTGSKSLFLIGIAFIVSFIGSLKLEYLIPLLETEAKVFFNLIITSIFTLFFVYGMTKLVRELSENQG
ncbi:hypothetical protein DRO97_01260 [Archaeoglobales archaeon]|nr:MAG: hypothetical protein DRO97_01260 [Archaeoglobales archaeon]